jgi:hypothetical protein
LAPGVPVWAINPGGAAVPAPELLHLGYQIFGPLIIS